MNQKTSKVEKEFYLRCSYLTLSVLFDKEPILLTHKEQLSPTCRQLFLSVKQLLGSMIVDCTYSRHFLL